MADLIDPNDARFNDELDAQRGECEQRYRSAIVEALANRGAELRELHHQRVVLDANAREKIADIVLEALGLVGAGEHCSCRGRADCYGGQIAARVIPAEQCRQYTIGWPAVS